MYTSALFASILAGSALALHPVEHLMRRQTLTNDIIPTQCQDTCSSSLPIYNACLSGDQSTCLTVCDSANFDSFVSCFNCIIQNVPGASSGDFQQAQQLIGQLEQACGQEGSSVSGSALETGSLTGSAIATGAGASFTSATSGITIGGGSSTGGLASITSNVAASASSASSAGGNAASSASSVVGGAASSAVSASASGAGNGGFVNAPNGVAALLLGAIGALAL